MDVLSSHREPNMAVAVNYITHSMNLLVDEVVVVGFV